MCSHIKLKWQNARVCLMQMIHQTGEQPCRIKTMHGRITVAAGDAKQHNDTVAQVAVHFTVVELRGLRKQAMVLVECRSQLFGAESLLQ